MDRSALHVAFVDAVTSEVLWNWRDPPTTILSVERIRDMAEQCQSNALGQQRICFLNVLDASRWFLDRCRGGTEVGFSKDLFYYDLGQLRERLVELGMVPSELPRKRGTGI